MNPEFPRLHPSIDAFDQRDGVLIVGGIPLPRLADRVGQTPFFVYDRRLITERVRHLRRKLPSEVALHYAIKANPMPAVVQHLATLVDGFDIASAHEMRTALDTPMTAANVSFAGPGKTKAELAQAIAAGITIEIESEIELKRVAELAEYSHSRPPVAVRINPDFVVKGSGMRMGGGPQQFGIDAEQVPEILHTISRLGLDFVGYHVFAGAQNLRADIIMESQTRIIDLILSLSAHAPAPIRHLNIGGGFGIPYFPKDTPLDLDPIGQNLKCLINDRLRPALPDAKIIVELGRYIVGEAGLYVTRVIDRKRSRDQIFLVTDGGLHHQLAASGNFGQVIRRNYPIAIGTRMCEPTVETVSVVGCLCTPLDLLADKVSLPRAEIGDLIVLFQSGAYGLTASPVYFLSHPIPPEVLV